VTTTTTQTTSTRDDDEQPGGPQPSAVEWVPVEPWPGPPPVPVLAPYLGLVTAVLCALGGGWLLLAPYALDFRHGAARAPRTTAVDLETGAAIVAVGIVTAVLFSAALVRRLRAEPGAGTEAGVQAEADEPAEPAPAPEPAPEPESASGHRSETAPGPDPAPASKQADPGGALRDLLTPLVAALAADLRSHDQDHRAHGHGLAPESVPEPRRQEP
jgi:hypothetical protein